MLTLLPSLSSGAQRFVDKLTAQTIPPTPAAADTIRALLAKGLPNEPDVGAQGSKRLDPGASLLAFGYVHNLLDEAILAAVSRFPAEEEGWRHLSTGGPVADVAHFAELVDGVWQTTGEPILNGAGDPVPVLLAKPTHATLRQSLLLACLTGDALSFSHAQALFTWAVGLPWATYENQRIFGWGLELAHDWWTVTGDPRATVLLHAIVDRLWALSLGQPHQGSLNGIPWLTLNSAADPDDDGAGSGQKDHDWKRASRWMTARSLKGLGDWRADLPSYQRLGALHDHAIWCEMWAMDIGEKLGGPKGSGVDDWDPTGKVWPQDFVFENKPLAHGVMDAFCVAGDLTVRAARPKLWESFFQERLQAQYLSNSRYRLAPQKLPDWHSASVALNLAAVAGLYRT